MIKEENMQTRCKCSGQYQFNVNKVTNALLFQLAPLLDNLKKLAHAHRFYLLQEMLHTVSVQ
jgi:hypothetical protein